MTPLEAIESEELSVAQKVEFIATYAGLVNLQSFTEETVNRNRESFSSLSDTDLCQAVEIVRKSLLGDTPEPVGSELDKLTARVEFLENFVGVLGLRRNFSPGTIGAEFNRVAREGK